MFPFTAIVGHDRLKTALILAALDPRLGGVLISGPRGTAKSTLARAMATLLPGNGTSRFITLPLGADEEQLIGTLDLEQALSDRTLAFRPGLLHRAHGGVLYIDEVNLLPDALVDQLLDVAASGINRIERDGISHEHPADFLLVGTMNPDEGELRPQLSDRFGLSVNLTTDYSAEQRIAIVERRLAFDRDPEAFTAHYATEQQQLAYRLADARQRLSAIELPHMQALQIANRSMQAGVEGVRADLCWQRAAIAHAAWQARERVTEEDINVVEAFVLNHRRLQSSGSPADTSPDDPSDDGSDDISAGSQHRRQRPPITRPDLGADNPAGNGFSGTARSWPRERSNATETDSTGDHGALSVPHSIISAAHAWADARLTPLPDMAVNLHHGVRTSASCSSKRSASSTVPRNRTPVRTARCTQTRIHWPRTLAGAAMGGHSLADSLCYRPLPRVTSELECLIVDTSASTLETQGIAELRSVLEKLLMRAYLARREIMLLGFGGQGSQWLSGPCRAPRRPEALLAGMSFGGGTPLRSALTTARQRLVQLGRQRPEQQQHSWLITDGRSRDHIDDSGWPSALTVLDTERAQIPLGRCRQLADMLGGRYLSLAQFRMPAIMASPEADQGVMESMQ